MGIVLFTSAISCIVSLFCASYMGYLDKRKQKLLDTDAIETGEVVSLWDVKDFPLRSILLNNLKPRLGTKMRSSHCLEARTDDFGNEIIHCPL